MADNLNTALSNTAISAAAVPHTLSTALVNTAIAAAVSAFQVAFATDDDAGDINAGGTYDGVVAVAGDLVLCSLIAGVGLQRIVQVQPASDPAAVVGWLDPTTVDGQAALTSQPYVQVLAGTANGGKVYSLAMDGDMTATEVTPTPGVSLSKVLSNAAISGRTL